MPSQTSIKSISKDIISEFTNFVKCCFLATFQFRNYQVGNAERYRPKSLLHIRQIVVFETHHVFLTTHGEHSLFDNGEKLTESNFRQF
jgi:hypothetical protein